MQTLQDAAVRGRMAGNARNAVLPFTPAAMTLKAVLLYRDLLAATVPARGPDRLPARAQAIAANEVPTLQRAVDLPAPRAAADPGSAGPGEDPEAQR
jgi:hypothetical protein